MFRVPELTVETPAPNSMKRVLLSWGVLCWTIFCWTIFQARFVFVTSRGVLMAPIFDSRNLTRSCKFLTTLIQSQQTSSKKTNSFMDPVKFLSRGNPTGWLGSKTQSWLVFLQYEHGRPPSHCIRLAYWWWSEVPLPSYTKLAWVTIAWGGYTYLLRQTWHASGTRRRFFGGGCVPFWSFSS